jgi:hypothetical protein
MDESNDMEFHQGDIEDEYGVWYGDGDLHDEELYDYDDGSYILIVS